MAKQTIQLYMWPVNSQDTPIVNTVTYPERSVTLVDGVYQARIQKPGIGQVIQVKLSQEIVNQFKIRLVRGDETLVTEALLTYIKIKKSTGVYQTVTYTFDSLTGYWTITSEQDFDDANGYWLEYLCSDGILTQYPYKYKTADKNNTSNLQSPGTYQDIIPYWKVEYTTTPTEIPELTVSFDDFAPGGVRQRTIFDILYLYIKPGTEFKKNAKVYSSIPYEVIYRFERDISVSGFLNYGDDPTGLIYPNTRTNFHGYYGNELYMGSDGYWHKYNADPEYNAGWIANTELDCGEEGGYWPSTPPSHFHGFAERPDGRIYLEPGISNSWIQCLIDFYTNAILRTSSGATNTVTGSFTKVDGDNSIQEEISYEGNVEGTDHFSSIQPIANIGSWEGYITTSCNPDDWNFPVEIQLDLDYIQVKRNFIQISASPILT